MGDLKTIKYLLMIWKQ